MKQNPNDQLNLDQKLLAQWERRWLDPDHSFTSCGRRQGGLQEEDPDIISINHNA